MLRSIANRLSRLAGTRQRPKGLAPRHAQAFATLLPVLTALASKYTIRRVLELGCGRHSTLTFLDRHIFPDLQQLISVENDKNWQSIILEEANDPRLQMHFAEGMIANSVTRKLAEGVQLILVDDSTCAADRAATIAKIVTLMSSNTLLAIHDFEVPEYQVAADGLPNRLVCDALTPQTGILSLEPIISPSWFQCVNKAIHKHHKSVPITDTVRWRNEFRSL